PYRKTRTVTAQAVSEFDSLVSEYERETGEQAVKDPNVSQEIALQQLSADATRPVADISLDRYPPLQSRAGEEPKKAPSGARTAPRSVDRLGRQESGAEEAEVADGGEEEGDDEVDQTDEKAS
ncbi:MAG: hypothetical protein ABEN55_03035, partial [Bradymonadaceae bacterium]